MAKIRRTTSLFIEVPNVRLICSAIRGQPQLGLCCFISTTARMMSTSGPFGPGLLLRFGENNNRYFLRTNARWKFNRVEGLSTTAARSRRVGFTKREQNPAINPRRANWGHGFGSGSERVVDVSIAPIRRSRNGRHRAGQVGKSQGTHREKERKRRASVDRIRRQDLRFHI